MTVSVHHHLTFLFLIFFVPGPALFLFRMSSLLTCPLCSQPGFQTLDSLRYGLISAATRQVVCPVCHDILFGLDKFTIHLFSHSVQEQDETSSSCLPIRISSFISATVPLNQHIASPSHTNNLLICTKEDFNVKVKNVKEYPLSDSHTKISLDKSQQTAPGSSVCCDKKIMNEEKLRVENMDDEQNCKIVSDTNEARKELQSEKPEINAVWKEQLGNKLDCKYTITSQNSNIPLLALTQSNNESVPVQTAKKSSDTVSEYMETSQMTNIRNISSSLGSKPVYPPYHYSAENIPETTHQNASVQCSALPLTPPPSQEKLTLVVPTEKEIKEIIRCDICGFAFDDSSILAIHCQLVHSMESGNETSNRRIQTANGSKQDQTLDEKRQFPCHLCSKAFKMRGSLMVHLRVAHSSGIASGVLFVMSGRKI